MSGSEPLYFQPIEALQQVLLAEDAFGVSELTQGATPKLESTPEEKIPQNPPCSCLTPSCAVAGEGPQDAAIVFLLSSALVAGTPPDELLGRMIEGMGLRRTDVLIGQVVRLGATEGASPQAPALLNPKVVCALGAEAACAVLGRNETLDELRGTTWDMDNQRTQLIATYHPDDLLRNGELKRAAWNDLKTVLALLVDA